MSESESSLQPKGAFRFAPWSVVLGVVGAICVTIWLMRPGELPSPLGNDPPIKKAEGRAPTDGVLEAPVEKRTDSLPSEDESQEPTVPREPELVLPKPTPSAHAPAVPHPLVLPAEPPIAARVDTGVPASVLDDELLPSPEKIAALKAEELATARELVAEFPDEVHAIIVLGNVYTRHGSTREAVRCWQRCAELAPDRVDAHIGLGDVAQRKGDFRQAAESWRRVIKMNPQTPGIHGKLA